MLVRLVCAAFSTMCLVAMEAAAYPEKPIRMIAPFAPGGNTDITARMVAQGLSERLRQPVVVENRAGAGGRIGTAAVAKAEPDGYTILLGSNGPLTINPGFSESLPYDPTREFAYTSLVSQVPIVISVHPNVPARNIKEFIALARSRPARITMGSAGVGSNTHLTGELFQLVTKTKFVHVPYKGNAAALIDLHAGHVDFMFDQLSSSSPFIKSGKLRPLGVATLKRSGMFPDLPTLDESGVPGFEASTYTGLLLPAGAPKQVVQRLYEALTQWLRQSATREKFADLGAEVLLTTPEEAARRVRDDIAKWKKVSLATGITIK